MAKEKQEKIKKTLNFTPRMIEMVEALQEREGMGDFTATVHAAIAHKYGKIFPEYILNRISGGTIARNGTALTVEEVAKKQVDLKDARERAAKENKEKEKSMICVNDMFGRVEEIDGHKYCLWNTYDENEKTPDPEQKMPLLMINSGYAKYQFSGGKDKVFAARPKLKAKLEKHAKFK